MDERDQRIGATEALHDVSNALTVVLGWLEEASRDDLSPEETRRAIEVAIRRAREARALAREAVGATPVPEVARRIGDIVSDAVEGLAVEAARAGVTFVVEGAGDGEVRGAVALGHIITNLLLNAIAFSPAGSTVCLRLTADARAVGIAISDQGPGVDPAIATMLFEGRTSRPGGAGVGLRHAREMTRRLGGDLLHIDVGGGATFEVRLPRYVAAATNSGDNPTPGAPSTKSVVSGMRLLILEDDRAVCALLDAGLGARGAEVIAVHDEASLLEQLAKSGRIDAVLLDLSPIAGHVQGSISAVKRAHPDAGIVFISGSAVALEQDLTADDPRARWVRKPFEVGEITRAIGELFPRR